MGHKLGEHDAMTRLLAVANMSEEIFMRWAPDRLIINSRTFRSISDVVSFTAIQ
jgi:integral membrane sensor domain MASE1